MSGFLSSCATFDPICSRAWARVSASDAISIRARASSSSFFRLVAWTGASRAPSPSTLTATSRACAAPAAPGPVQAGGRSASAPTPSTVAARTLFPVDAAIWM